MLMQVLHVPHLHPNLSYRDDVVDQVKMMMMVMMMMMMTVTMFSFWIKPEAVPARVTLGVTSLLTLSTQHANSQKSLPPVSYIKVTSSSSIMAALLHCTCPWSCQ